MKQLLTTLFLLSLAGCANNAQVSATQRLTETEKAYRIVLSTMADARDAGLVTQAQLDATKPERAAVDAALAAAEADQKKGDVSALGEALDTASAALSRLQPILDQINGKKASP